MLSDIATDLGIAQKKSEVAFMRKNKLLIQSI